ncbi:hypothetical protein SDJN03_23311, partial [Cucurbita argyrosperma subsp. sororia]
MLNNSPWTQRYLQNQKQRYRRRQPLECRRSNRANATGAKLSGKKKRLPPRSVQVFNNGSHGMWLKLECVYGAWWYCFNGVYGRLV